MRATPFTDEELTRLGRGDITDQFGNDHKRIATHLAQEVLWQRQWLAYVARVIEAQTFDLKALAKCRRSALELTVDDLRALCRGHTVSVNRRSLQSEYERVLALGEGD